VFANDVVPERVGWKVLLDDRDRQVTFYGDCG
jgi:hypothetical protein